jgi:hypothetical protein
MKAPFHVAACTLILGWIGFGSAAAQKPVTTLITRPTPFPPPASTELLWTSADAVVCGRVIGSTVRERRPGSGTLEPVLATDYSLHVDEVLKPSDGHKIAGNVTVRLPGGAMEYPDRILINKEDGFPPLDKEAAVILFLKWSPSDDSYVPLAGPDGVFLDSAGIVRSPGRSAMARSNAGKPAKKFLEEIRAIAKSKKSPAP